MYAFNPPTAKPNILVTVDVEDWFQVENFRGTILPSDWPSLENRVERNTNRILDSLDSFGSGREPGDGRIRATFFVLGWVAKRFPGLVKEIHARGHEVASHGFSHTLCNHQPSQEVFEDLRLSKEILEDISGAKVEGFRAPSFSISDEVLRIAEDCGYAYDSSFNSFARQGRYGTIRLSPNGNRGFAFEVSDHFFELPVSNLRFGRTVIPWGGGGYFRLLPSFLFCAGVRRQIRKEGTFLFYIHPWEIDPDQPRVEEASAFSRFRHYHNLKKTQRKFEKFITEFRSCVFPTCRQYLDSLTS